MKLDTNTFLNELNNDDLEPKNDHLNKEFSANKQSLFTPIQENKDEEFGDSQANKFTDKFILEDNLKENTIDDVNGEHKTKFNISDEHKTFKVNEKKQEKNLVKLEGELPEQADTIFSEPVMEKEFINSSDIIKPIIKTKDDLIYLNENNLIKDKQNDINSEKAHLNVALKEKEEEETPVTKETLKDIQNTDINNKIIIDSTNSLRKLNKANIDTKHKHNNRYAESSLHESIDKLAESKTSDHKHEAIEDILKHNTDVIKIETLSNNIVENDKNSNEIVKDKDIIEEETQQNQNKVNDIQKEEEEKEKNIDSSSNNNYSLLTHIIPGIVLGIGTVAISYLLFRKKD